MANLATTHNSVYRGQAGRKTNVYFVRLTLLWLQGSCLPILARQRTYNAKTFQKPGHHLDLNSKWPICRNFGRSFSKTSL